MTSASRDIKRFLDAGPVALVEVVTARGSTPREAGAWMLVSSDRIRGTIGGGQLEFMAIDKAREMMAHALHANAVQERPPLGRCASEILSIPLGPEIGQCCGGRVDVSVRLVDEAISVELLKKVQEDDAAQPHVFLFGGGHVGRSLAAAFALLPVKVTVVETRAEALEDMPEGVETELTPLPDAIVRAAPPGSAFVVLTHDHALDFLIVAEALRREDAAYVGMIGSKTKKATFRSWYLKTAGGSEVAFARLVSPIGGGGVADKRPAVIAALAAAEIVTALAAVASRLPQPRVERSTTR